MAISFIIFGEIGVNLYFSTLHCDLNIDRVEANELKEVWAVVFIVLQQFYEIIFEALFRGPGVFTTKAGKHLVVEGYG